MDEYHGVIDNISIQNISDPARVDSDGFEFLEMTTAHVSFVHYPDCQQLSLQIPNNGWDYKSFRLTNITENQILEDDAMINKLNGNYKIVFDTVGLKPGNYSMELIYKFGFKHLVSFIKYELGEVAKVITPVVMEPLVSNLTNDRNRKVAYEGNLRAATIIYSDSKSSIRFSSEMGGGDCFFYIMVPTEQQWERLTHTPLNERDEILQFVAKAMQREQASGKRFEIGDAQITYYQ